MRPSAAIVGMLLGFLLVLGGCGEDRTPVAAGPSSTASTTARAGEDAAAEPSPRRSCRRELAPFVTSLVALRDDLARGLSYDDYLRQVQATRAAYDRIHPDRVPPDCLLIGGDPAEDAFNLYIDAANTWGDCLATVSCDTRSIEPRLQRKWALAENRVAIAHQGLRSLSAGS